MLGGYLRAGDDPAATRFIRADGSAAPGAVDEHAASLDVAAPSRRTPRTGDPGVLPALPGYPDVMGGIAGP
jgi:hypothetical protein